MNGHQCPTCGQSLQLVEVPDLFSVGRSTVSVACTTPLCWRGPIRETAPEAIEAAAPILRSAWDRALEETGRIMAALTPEEVEQGKAMVHGLIPPLAQILGLLTIKEDGGVWNHLSWRIGGAPAPIGELELVLQRVEGETPAQQRDIAKAEAAELRAAIERIREGAASNAGRCLDCASVEALAAQTLDAEVRIADDIKELWRLQAREQALSGALRDLLAAVTAHAGAIVALNDLDARRMVNMPDLQRRQRDVQEKTALLRSAMEAAQGLVDKDNRLQPVDR